MKLRYLAEINPSTPEFDQLPDDAEVTFVPLEGVWPGSGWDSSRTRPKNAVANGYTRFREGDVLLPKINPTFQGDRSTIARDLAGGVGAGTTEVHVVRPRTGVDGRYLDYLMSTQRFLHVGEAEMVGVAGQKRVPTDFLLNFEVPTNVQAEQRSIADFLDTETARIDALVAKKQQMIQLADERDAAAFGAAAEGFGAALPSSIQHDHVRTHPWPDNWRVVSLGRTLRQLTNGYVGPTRDLLVESGVRYIQSLHIKDGRIDFGRRPYFVPHEWHLARPRIHLVAEDVLIVQTGDIGQVAYVPEGFGEASCHALQIARPHRHLLDSRFLVEYLRSTHGYNALLQMATGALHPHLEAGIRAVPIPLPPLKEQRGIADAVCAVREANRELCGKLRDQIDLLREHRQALITAAVTGQMDVPGVAA